MKFYGNAYNDTVFRNIYGPLSERAIFLCDQLLIISD